MTVSLVLKATSVTQLASRHLGLLSGVTTGPSVLKAQMARLSVRLTTTTVLSQQVSSWPVLSASKECMQTGTGTALIVKVAIFAHLGQKQCVLLAITAKLEKVRQLLALRALIAQILNRLRVVLVLRVPRDSLVPTQAFPPPLPAIQNSTAWRGIFTRSLCKWSMGGFYFEATTLMVIRI